MQGNGRVTPVITCTRVFSGTNRNIQQKTAGAGSAASDTINSL